MLALVPTRAVAQHEHHPAPASDTMTMEGMAMRGAAPSPLGIPMSRTGSGTSWLPDSSPMHARHVAAGSWELMLHGEAFVQYDRQFTKRGDEQLGSINWGMLMARHPLGGGVLTLRGMMSLEPFTIGARGYPLILQSGESYRGRPLVDRQHPHDLFMELAAVYERAIARNLAVELYVAPVGEPALGPVAFPHRPSAESDPYAPLSHHWQDATHITFGTITAGVYSRTWKLEGSIFNGREPDEHRTNFDYARRSLDSYSGRLTVNPDAHWSLSASYGYLESPEELHPDESLHRISASALYAHAFGGRGEWAGTLVWGANEHRGGGGLSNSVVAEGNIDLDGANTIFGRAEWVQKSAADLALGGDVGAPVAGGGEPTGIASDRQFDIGAFAAGYLRELARFGGVSLGIGFRGSLDIVPRTLEPVYGTRTPGGLALFLRVRPSRMQMGDVSMNREHSSSRR